MHEHEIGTAITAHADRLFVSPRLREAKNSRIRRGRRAGDIGGTGSNVRRARRVNAGDLQNPLVPLVPLVLFVLFVPSASPAFSGSLPLYEHDHERG